ncbi:hypothetical protein KDU71_17170 [Carboxylicivirga sediminis]|uniref:Uncharacterized protein n=1 Tax=Carboxylicivirga sediminis TaxID=2006564 RepID=A0A941F5N6_9BACT|nr:hypothetical protein [Carboxylicivirga sediminis]MBR8537303.1 hypothetical protein [Carboxylicivirga sediminis]
MKENKKHIDEIDQLLNQMLVTNYEPSDGFIDKVMVKVQMERPASKYIKMLLQVAAAAAIIVFTSNLFILTTATKNIESNESDWATVYQLETTTNWYEYNSENTFIANNQTLK